MASQLDQNYNVKDSASDETQPSCNSPNNKKVVFLGLADFCSGSS